MTKRILTLMLTLLALGLAARVETAAQEVRAPVVSGASQTPPEKARDIRRLLELTGIIERELRSIDVIFDSFKQRMPQVRAKDWEEVKNFIREEFTAETIIEMYVPIYSRHFTAQEIKQLIAFYQTPVGRKWVAEAATMESEAFLSGMERGMRLSEKLMEKLKAKGYNVPQA